MDRKTSTIYAPTPSPRHARHAHTRRALRSAMHPQMIGEASLVAAAETQHQVKGRLLLDVVIRKRAAVLELLASEDETLLVRRDPLLVLDLGLNVLNRVGWLHLKRHSLAGKGLNE